MPGSTDLFKKLSFKQKLFAELCAKGQKQVEAYGNAGYSVNGKSKDAIAKAASRCMSNVGVKSYYNSLLKEATIEAIEDIKFDKQDWLRTQMELLSMAMGKTETQMTSFCQGEFFQSTLKNVDLTNAFKAQEQLGKMLALFVDKKELKGDLTIKNLIAEISKEAGDSENDSPLPKDHV